MSALRKELSNAIHSELYDVTEEGIFFPKQGVIAKGEYFHRVNNGEWDVDANLITTEGLAHILNVSLGVKPKATGYYLTLFSGSAAPANNWTAANFASVASEITSLSEGYTSPTRPEWVPKATTTSSIDNMEEVATVTISTSSSLNVTGSALLSNSTRGGTSGVLISASKYATARVFQDGDKYDIGYRISITV